MDRGQLVVTKLDRPLKRGIDIGEQPYTLTVEPAGFRLVPKGKRNGIRMSWDSLVSGDAALAAALNASILGTPPATEPAGKAGRRTGATPGTGRKINRRAKR